MSLSLDSFRKIDAHIHYNCRKYDALNYASEKKFDLVSINSEIDYFPPLRQQEKVILDFKKKTKIILLLLHHSLQKIGVGRDGKMRQSGKLKRD